MKHPDLVSVLMPAFKPQYMREALKSVLGQTHEHIEVLIGDNSGNPEIQAILAEFDDPRVIYIPSHRVTNASVHINHMLLWWRAKGRYVRYVYDDDVAYPRSTEMLLDLLKRQPGCAMSWHQRDIIDAASQVLGRQNFLGAAESVVMDRDMLLTNLSSFLNFVGEPSFVMFDKSLHKDFNFNRYDGFELRFLWDVAAYLEASKAGMVTGSAEVLGAFRRHDAQISAALNPNFVFGCIEWELVFRNELANGQMTAEAVHGVLSRIALLYKSNEATVPALLPFRVQLEADLAAHRLAEEAPRFNAAYRALSLAHGR